MIRSRCLLLRGTQSTKTTNNEKAFPAQREGLLGMYRTTLTIFVTATISCKARFRHPTADLFATAAVAHSTMTDYLEQWGKRLRFWNW